MQSATGQYGTQAGEPAQPVQHSVMTASSLGRFLRGVAIPSDFGSILTMAVSMPRIMTQFAGDQFSSLEVNVMLVLYSLETGQPVLAACTAVSNAAWLAPGILAF